MSALNLKIRESSLQTDRSTFDCGNASMNDFIKNSLDTCCKYKFCTSYEVIDIESNELVAIFALSFDSLHLDDDDINEVITSKFDSENNIPFYYRDIFMRKVIFPSLTISHLAVRKEHQRKGIGLYILNAVAVLATEQKIGGCQFITVDAINQKEVVAFYYKNYFSRATPPEVYSDTIKMYKMI